VPSARRAQVWVPPADTAVNSPTWSSPEIVEARSEPGSTDGLGCSGVQMRGSASLTWEHGRK